MLKVRIIAYCLVLALFVAALESGARFIAPAPGAGKEEFSARLYATHYSQAEMDRYLPLHQERQGGNCLTYRMDKLYWNPWWGYAAKRLDAACAAALFARHPVKVVLMGGSAMFNAEAPNHLTHLDYLAFGGDERIASINLAESGARLSNMLARFIREVLPLRPDVAVFMDGFNEFNSVRYGGDPGDDFYWTAGVRRRIESPLGAMADKLVEASAFFRIVLVNTGLHRSARVPPTRDATLDHRPDVRVYLRDRDVLNTLCDAYAIKCVFILQPIAFTTSVENENLRRVLAAHNRFFPHDGALYRAGYAEIRQHPCPNCIDASDLLAGTGDAFFDVVHFTKLGGEKLGRAIHAAVLAAIGGR